MPAYIERIHVPSSTTPSRNLATLEDSVKHSKHVENQDNSIGLN